MKMHYGKLWKIYESTLTWKDFVNTISRGRSRWIFLEALESGWENRIRKDLLERYDAPEAEIELLLQRYESIIATGPTTASASELREEMMKRVLQANIMRGYLRYANYTALDDSDDIIWTIDTGLAELGSGTPTKEECATSYAIVTGKVVDPGAVVIREDTADKIAIGLAAQIEKLHRHLAQPGNKNAPEIISKIRELGELHSALTGKSLIGDIDALYPKRKLANTRKR